VERCSLVSRAGALTELEPTPDGAAALVPTFTPAQHERAVHTRAAASAIERRQRTMQARALHACMRGARPSPRLMHARERRHC
jgi:acetyl-CoA acetyltransferase